MKRSLVFLFLLCSCATSGTTPGGVKTPDPLLDLELYLRRLPTVQMRYTVETTGAREMTVRGSVSWDENHVRIDASALLDGEKRSNRYDRPYDRKRDVAESWVRVGLAHNLYRILNNQEVEVLNARAENVKIEKGHYTFDVVVDGKDIGDAELWLDASGLPIKREQTMQFPQGEMKIVERYLWLQ
jgi:hypothetical protein